MIRARAGRARFVTHLRATVRAYPPPYDDTEEDSMQVSRTIDTPQALIKVCQEVGAEVRPGGKGFVVYGPNGIVSVSARWGNDRAKQNCLAELRRAGVDIANLPHRRTGTEGATVDIPKLVTTGGRPALAYSNTTPTPAPPPTTEPAVTTAMKPVPTPADLAKRRPEPEGPPPAKQADLDALLELVDTLSNKVAVLSRRIEKVEKATASAGIEADPGQETREKILAWFRQLPPGMKVTAGVIVSNLCTDNVEREAWRRQLGRLVEMGQIQAHRSRDGRGGAIPEYSLPVESADEPAEQTA